MRFDLGTVRNGPTRPDRVDGRGPMYFAGPVVGLVPPSGRVSEFLHALPMVKGEGLAESTSSVLAVAWRRGPVPPAASSYDGATAAGLFDTSPGIQYGHLLSRIGLRVQEILIDDRATADATGDRESYWRVLAAAYAVLRELDTQIAQGTGAETPVKVRGLAQLGTDSGRFAATSGDVESDARKALGAITPNDVGPGAGPDCLIGNDRMLRRCPDAPRLAAFRA